MIGYADIKNAVLEALKKSYPDINRPATDIKSGFPRPAFFVQIMPISEAPYDEYSEVLLTVNIHYFSKEMNDTANLIMLDKLNIAFKNKLKVKDRIMSLQEKRHTIQDNVLQFKFDLNYTVKADSVEVNGEDIYDLDESLGYTPESIKLMQELEVDESEVN